MAIQFVDANARAVGTTVETYNISSSNDQFSVAIDGGSNQVITLTHGSARTAAQVVSDINATLTSATASVATVNTGNYVCITTASANGNSSSILFNTPTNNAVATLGFQPTTYYGGTRVSNTFMVSAKQDIINGIEDNLNTAGWLTLSGHHSTNVLLQSCQTPSTQNLMMNLRIKDNSNNCAVVSIENSYGTKVTTNGTANGGQLLPGTSETWQIIANKYQAFVFVQSSTTARKFACWGVPWLPTAPALAGGTIYECIWMNCNAASDTDSTTRGSFRTMMGFCDISNGEGNYQLITNGNVYDWGNNTGQSNQGTPTLVTMFRGSLTGNTASGYRWHTGEAFLTDPLIAWGSYDYTQEATVKGQLWDAFISMEAYTVDTALSSVDGHNWQAITGSNAGNGSNQTRGTLFVTTS